MNSPIDTEKAYQEYVEKKFIINCCDRSLSDFDL